MVAQLVFPLLIHFSLFMNTGRFPYTLTHADKTARHETISRLSSSAIVQNQVQDEFSKIRAANAGRFGG